MLQSMAVTFFATSSLFLKLTDMASHQPHEKHTRLVLFYDWLFLRLIFLFCNHVFTGS